MQEQVGTLRSVAFFCKSKQQVIGKSEELMIPVLGTLSI